MPRKAASRAAEATQGSIMFFEEGWVPLSEVTAEVFRRLQGFAAEGPIAGADKGLGGILAISVWDICDACTKIGATGPDGTVVPASKDLLSWADPRNLSNEHVDLTVGSVGSSSLKDDTGAVPSRDALALRYGPFLNLPLVIPINNYQSSLTFLEEEVKGHDARDPELLRAAQVIIKMSDGEGLLTREIARRTLGSGVSRRKFKFAWALAAQHRPELAAANRWAGL